MLKVSVLSLCVLIVLSVNAIAEESALSSDSTVTRPSDIVVRVGHRMYPDFGERVTTAMDTIQPIGDTDMYFQVVAFYPHFAYLDSSKSYVSLSEELENPAFRISVFENDELVDQAWAFFKIKAPHFPSNSYVYFDVVEFTYRGEKYQKNEPSRED